MPLFSKRQASTTGNAGSSFITSGEPECAVEAVILIYFLHLAAPEAFLCVPENTAFVCA